MRQFQGLILLGAIAIVGTLPVAGAGKSPAAVDAGNTGAGGERPANSRLHGNLAKLDSCRQKMEPTLKAKLGGLVEVRDVLQKDYLEQRQALLESNPDMRKMEAEIRVKLLELRKKKGGEGRDSRAEVERLIQTSRALKKSLTGAGEIKRMRDQLKGLDKQINDSASEILGEVPGCLEFKETLTLELGERGRILRSSVPGHGNPESTLK